MLRTMLAAAVGLALWSGVAAADLAEPEGMVVLTVHGEVGVTNRGPLDEFDDAFFQFGGISFDRAATFDLAMLDAMAQHRIETTYPNWPRSHSFEGPLLRDVLDAAGAAEGETVTVVAIDGYLAELPMAFARSEQVVLATRADGRLLSLGGRGPLWLVWPAEAAPEQPVEDDAGLVWAAIRIEVR